MLSKWLNEREITNAEEIDKLLSSCMVCSVAFRGGDYPYVVPLCFGYNFRNGELELFFRCDEKGRKTEALKENNHVSFELHKLYDMRSTEYSGGFNIPMYRSITGTGVIEVITGIEKLTGLGYIMKKFEDAPDNNKIPEQLINSLAVLKLTVTEFRCRENNYEG